LGFGIYKSVKIGSLTVHTNPDADDTSDMIKLHDISYSVEGRPLLENASATIPAGHKVGLVGRNGTGKTTLFRLIRGELSLETGSIDLPRQARIGGVA
jgi:ATP-binding cassette subfamily F protein 3